MPPVLRGMSLVARGRAEGLNCFRDTPRAVLWSLVPMGLLYGHLVVRVWFNGNPLATISMLTWAIIILLAPLVLSYELARVWGREAFWYRYAVALNWCHLIVPIIVAVLTVVAAAIWIVSFGTGAAPGVNPPMLLVLVFCLSVYGLWIQWFITRHGLALTAGRSAILVIGVNAGTSALVAVPLLLSAFLP